jgi:hypothetical protein
MRRLPTTQAPAAAKGAAVKNWRYIALHSAAAAIFIFTLQRFALNASLETSLVWALTFGFCAAGLAYMQSNR